HAAPAVGGARRRGFCSARAPRGGRGRGLPRRPPGPAPPGPWGSAAGRTAGHRRRRRGGTRWRRMGWGGADSWMTRQDEGPEVGTRELRAGLEEEGKCGARLLREHDGVHETTRAGG